MVITSASVLSGPYAPDPTYKNLYFYDAFPALTIDPNKVPRDFFLYSLHDSAGNPIPGLVYNVTFPTGTALYPIGETETGFTVELPTDDGFPAKPLYLIIGDNATGTLVFRYAFIEGYSRTGSNKIRCSCRFDQWTEHYHELMNAEFTFSRRHQKRYVNRSLSPRTKLYNGLSDPIPEGMVQGTTRSDPVKVYGARTMTVHDANGHIAIPLWLYWRLSVSDFSVKDTSEGTFGPPQRLLGIDPPKFAVPIMATCVGIIDYNPTTELSMFYPTWKVYKSGGGVLTNCAISAGVETEQTALVRAIDTIGKGHPYIAQSWMTTISPFDVSLTFDFSDAPESLPTVRRPCIKIEDSRFDNIMTPGDGHYYKIGSSETPLDLNPGTFINLPIASSSPFPTGVRKTVSIHTNTQTGDFSYTYEPKIEESPYEGITLFMYGAEIDVSPTPANPAIDLSVEVGGHGDVVLKSGSTEIYRSSGVCSQYGVDAATDSLTSWLVSNYQTYQNAKLWKTINTGIGSAVSIISGAATGNVAGIVGGGIKAVTGYGETVTGERARYADLAASPNATTISSENAFDNFPFVDLPRIKKRTITSGIKTAIMNYWHIYGYPDNKTGTISADATLRESFSFVQGSFVRPLPGVYPGEISEITAALRAGSWLWKCRRVGEDARGVARYVYVDTTTDLLTLNNSEVVPNE